MLSCEIFALLVLILTAVWVYVGRKLSFHTLALAMFFPAIVTVLFADDGFVSTVVGASQVSISMVFEIISPELARICLETMQMYFVLYRDGKSHFNFRCWLDLYPSVPLWVPLRFLGFLDGVLLVKVS